MQRKVRCEGLICFELVAHEQNLAEVPIADLAVHVCGPVDRVEIRGAKLQTALAELEYLFAQLSELRGRQRGVARTDFDASQAESFCRGIIFLSSTKPRGLAMYVLIIIIAVLSPATGSVTPVGVTSQIVGKFKNLDQCTAAASKQNAGGAISDLSLSRGVYWYCAYAGARAGD